MSVIRASLFESFHVCGSLQLALGNLFVYVSSSVEMFMMMMMTTMIKRKIVICVINDSMALCSNARNIKIHP